MAIRRCVNCGHNIRDEGGNYICELDDHVIGYVENFEFWCRRWKKDRKFTDNFQEIVKYANKKREEESEKEKERLKIENDKLKKELEKYKEENFMIQEPRLEYF